MVSTVVETHATLISQLGISTPHTINPKTLEKLRCQLFRTTQDVMIFQDGWYPSQRRMKQPDQLLTLLMYVGNQRVEYFNLLYWLIRVEKTVSLPPYNLFQLTQLFLRNHLPPHWFLPVRKFQWVQQQEQAFKSIEDAFQYSAQTGTFQINTLQARKAWLFLHPKKYID